MCNYTCVHALRQGVVQRDAACLANMVRPSPPQRVHLYGGSTLAANCSRQEFPCRGRLRQTLMRDSLVMRGFHTSRERSAFGKAPQYLDLSAQARGKQWLPAEGLDLFGGKLEERGPWLPCG